jgi:hypothetical protein
MYAAMRPYSCSPVQEGNQGVGLPMWRPPHEKFVELSTFTSRTRGIDAVRL